MIQAEEIIGYDLNKKMFTSIVFSNLSGDPVPYEWDINGNKVKHYGSGATYRGTVSDDGNTITGRWSPDEGTEETDVTSYVMTMFRVTGK